MVPERAGVVAGLDGQDVADRAVVDAFDRFALRPIVALAEAGDDRQILLRRASSAVSSTLRTPGASTATGFSQNTCLPAAMAAFRCAGRKWGGVARITTSTSVANSFS